MILDVYTYPIWIENQRQSCECTFQSSVATCMDSTLTPSHISSPSDPLTWCVAKGFLLNHMPEFDKHYLPPSVSITGDSMFDDTLAFALMADHSNTWSTSIPLDVRLTYILPYSGYHESRQNWRPLFFAKFYSIVADAQSPAEAMRRLIAPNVFLNWTAHVWDSRPILPNQTDFNLQWSSSTSPPIADPFSFISYGYSSCTGWATMVTYLARSVGIPARQVGTPCWNSIFENVDFRGLAQDNPNVTLCWHGGAVSNTTGQVVGGGYLNNHNWCEWYDPEIEGGWVFQNVPPQDNKPDSQSLCPNWSAEHGCGWDAETGCKEVTGGPGAAARDHEIFSVTWSPVSSAHTSIDSEELKVLNKYLQDLNGGDVIDVANLKLSNGEPVSPLVWAPHHKSPIGEILANVGLRVVNRTDFYRCH